MCRLVTIPLNENTLNTKTLLQCAQGYYCVEGNTEPAKCGSAAMYCPAGSVSPLPVGTAFYSAPLTVRLMHVCYRMFGCMLFSVRHTHVCLAYQSIVWLYSSSLLTLVPVARLPLTGTGRRPVRTKTLLSWVSLHRRHSAAMRGGRGLQGRRRHQLHRRQHVLPRRR